MTVISHRQDPQAAKAMGNVLDGMGLARLSRKRRAEFRRGDSPRTGEPVWRNSYYVGTIEQGRVWKPINGGTPRGGKRWTGALLKAAKRLELETRAKRRESDPGARNGVLGEVGIAVLEYLYSVVDYATGKLEPAIRTIADEIGRAYSAVHEALGRLRAAGFLRWIRRSKPKDNPEPGGPTIEQASNAYALLVPREFQDWLKRLVGPGPVPACEEDRRRELVAESERMFSRLTCAEQGRQTGDWGADKILGDILASIGKLVDEREAQHRESGRSDVTGGSDRSIE